MNNVDPSITNQLQKNTDGVMYGESFEDASGKRIDPARVTVNDGTISLAADVEQQIHKMAGAMPKPPKRDPDPIFIGSKLCKPHLMIKIDMRTVVTLAEAVAEWSQQRRDAARLVPPTVTFGRWYTLEEPPVRRDDESRQVFRARVRAFGKL